MAMRGFSKYRAIKTKRDGFTFDSKMEAEYYDLLKLREKAGEIAIIGRQCKVYLTNAKILMKPDFIVRDLKSQEMYYIEVKGVKTSDFAIKLRLWEHYGPAPLLLVETNRGKIIKETLYKVTL